MTTPDLTALRALVEAVESRRVTTAALLAHMSTCDDCGSGRASAPCASLTLAEKRRMAMEKIDTALPAAQAALKRMELVMAAPNGHPCDPGYWPHDHSSACYRASVLWLRARLAELKEALTSHQCSAGATWCGKHRRFHGYLCDALEGRNATIPPKEK